MRTGTIPVGERMARKKLGEILIEAGVIDEMKLHGALAEQRKWGGQLGKILIEMGISEDAMMRALSAQLHFPLVDLDHVQVDPQVLELVSPDLAEKHMVIPFGKQMKFLDVAMGDPTNVKILDQLRINTQLNVRPHLAGPRMIERALQRLYGRGFDHKFSGTDLRRAQAPATTNTRMLDESTLNASETPHQRQVRESQSHMTAAQQRAAGMSLGGGLPSADHTISALQQRVTHLEALVARDEDVLRKLLAFLIEKGIATREEILAKLT
jgi:hypothetical protein